MAAPSRACAGKKLIHKDALDSQQPGLIEYLFPVLDLRATLAAEFLKRFEGKRSNG